MSPDKKDLRPSALPRLLEIMRQLRDPLKGCPWDLEQSSASIAHYAIEEAYEVVDAIERGDVSDLRDELGDLLLQVVFHSQMAGEKGQFCFDDVAESISAKMIRRHPHVFGSASIEDTAAQTASWEVIKADERQAKASTGILDGVALALPALTRAEKLQKRAARHGFDWTEIEPVFDKIAEETAEIRAAQAADEPLSRLEEEVGDLLFSVVNLARKLSVEPEIALRRANAKFHRRFAAIEDSLERDAKAVSDQSLDALDALWDRVKEAEKISKP